MRLAQSLPSPPTDVEKYAYLGRQRRWVVFAQFTGFCSIVASMVLFMLRMSWAWVPLAPPLGLTVLASLLSLMTASRRRRVQRRSYDAVVNDWVAGSSTSVDIFLPSAGEPLQVLANTFQHVAAIEWDGPLEVYVLDDADSRDVAALAARFGFHYASRPDRGHFKKAGNLRFGYEHSTGDFICIFDADFCPRPDFLASTMPFMADNWVGIVQTPQYFDAHGGQNWLQRSAGATQEFFYRWVQPARDRSDGAICVGTNAVYRRAALAKAGGFAQIGHSEDVHTGVRLLGVGYATRYVPVVLAKGVCPDHVNQFVVQQYRWCTGSMSLLFSKSFHRTPMALRQRLCFWTGFMYYITTGINVFVIWLPPLLIGYFAPTKMHAANYVLVCLAVLIRLSLIPVLTSDRGSWVGLARVQMLYSFAHAVALFDVVRGRSASWVATGAARGTALSRKIRAVTSIWLVAAQGLIWTAIVRDVPKYGIANFWPMALAALINLYTIGPLVIGRAEPFRRPRRTSRTAQVSVAVPAPAEATS